ncbi:hypothetical protein LCGC14_2664740, partial [marine sediment metagenome]
CFFQTEFDVTAPDNGFVFTEYRTTNRSLKDPEEAALEAFRQQVALDLEKDILAHLGDQWTLVSAPSLGGVVTGTVLSVSLKNPPQFSATLARLEARAIEPGVLPAPPDIRTVKMGQTEIHYLARLGKGLPTPVAPAWAVHDGRFYLAAYPQVVMAAIAGPGPKRLVQTPAYRQAVSKLSPNPLALMYFDTPRLLPLIYTVGLIAWTAGSGPAAQATGRDFTPAMLPTLATLSKYVKPNVAAVSADAGGIWVESYGSLPSGAPFANTSGSQLALMATVFVPTFGRAQHLAKRSISAANLNTLGKNVHIYMAEFEEVPPDYQTLFKRGLSPQALISPMSGRKLRRDAQGNPVGPFDYIYLGGRFKEEPQGNMLMAYERPENYRNEGTNVLTYQGSVQWMDMATFREALARAEKFIREQAN